MVKVTHGEQRQPAVVVTYGDAVVVDEPEDEEPRAKRPRRPRQKKPADADPS